MDHQYTIPSNTLVAEMVADLHDLWADLYCLSDPYRVLTQQLGMGRIYL